MVVDIARRAALQMPLHGFREMVRGPGKCRGRRRNITKPRWGVLAHKDVEADPMGPTTDRPFVSIGAAWPVLWRRGCTA